MAKNWLVACAIDWVAIVIAMVISYVNYWFIPLSILLIGNRQHALAILGHDGAHQLVVRRNRQINDIITNILTFYPLGLCLKEYRKFHWIHHVHTGDIKDPELPLKESPIPMAGRYSYRIYLHALLDLFGFGVLHIARFLHHVRPRKLSDSGAIVFQLLVSAAFIATGLWLVPVLWFVSLLTSFWCFFRLRVWAEHVGGGVGQTLVFQARWWERLLFLPHGSEYHYEHHCYPAVEFNKLHECRPKDMSLTTLPQAQRMGIYR